MASPNHSTPLRNAVRATGLGLSSLILLCSAEAQPLPTPTAGVDLATGLARHLDFVEAEAGKLDRTYIEVSILNHVTQRAGAHAQEWDNLRIVEYWQSGDEALLRYSTPDSISSYSLSAGRLFSSSIPINNRVPVVASGIGTITRKSTSKVDDQSRMETVLQTSPFHPITLAGLASPIPNTQTRQSIERVIASPNEEITIAQESNGRLILRRAINRQRNAISTVVPDERVLRLEFTQSESQVAGMFLRKAVESVPGNPEIVRITDFGEFKKLGPLVVPQLIEIGVAPTALYDSEAGVIAGPSSSRTRFSVKYLIGQEVSLPEDRNSFPAGLRVLDEESGRRFVASGPPWYVHWQLWVSVAAGAAACAVAASLLRRRRRRARP